MFQTIGSSRPSMSESVTAHHRAPKIAAAIIDAGGGDTSRPVSDHPETQILSKESRIETRLRIKTGFSAALVKCVRGRRLGPTES